MQLGHMRLHVSLKSEGCQSHLLVGTAGGFGNDRSAALQAPGQQHLGWRLAQPGRYASHPFILSKHKRDCVMV